MITAHTLVGLACLLSQANPGEQKALKKPLGNTEKMHIEFLMRNDPCLPESFESLVKETDLKIRAGDETLSNIVASPTRDCLTD